MGGKNSGRKPGSKTKKIILVNGEPGKVCIGPACNGQVTPLSAFGNHKSYCLKCDKLIKTTIRESDYVGYKYQEALRHAKEREKKGRSCEVAPNLKELMETMRNEQKYCYYSGVQLMEKVAHPNSWSVDRVDFHAGYVAENIVLCATTINHVKGFIETTLDQVTNKLIPLYGEEKTSIILKNIFKAIK